MSDLPERLRDLREAIKGLEWELPITAQEDLEEAISELKVLKTTRKLVEKISKEQNAQRTKSKRLVKDRP